MPAFFKPLKLTNMKQVKVSQRHEYAQWIMKEQGLSHIDSDIISFINCKFMRQAMSERVMCKDMVSYLFNAYLKGRLD